jgi:hypothetical protein
MDYVAPALDRDPLRAAGRFKEREASSDLRILALEGVPQRRLDCGGPTSQSYAGIGSDRQALISRVRHARAESLRG